MSAGSGAPRVWAVISSHRSANSERLWEAARRGGGEDAFSEPFTIVAAGACGEFRWTTGARTERSAGLLVGSTPGCVTNVHSADQTLSKLSANRRKWRVR